MNSLVFSFSFAVAVLTNALSGIVEAAEQGAAPRPHIVYIVADDLGWKDIGFHGSEIRRRASIGSPKRAPGWNSSTFSRCARRRGQR